MGFFQNIFRRNGANDEQKTGGMEDFMTLIRVYYQAAIAQKVGITNLAMLPDLRVFKQTLHVPTVNNKLGIGEKNRCKKMLTELYGINEFFFKEIDESIKGNCKSLQDVQRYFFMFQGFSQELLMVVSNTLQLRLRIPGIFKKTIRSVVEKGINDILTKDNWKDDATRKSVYELRSQKKRLGYSAAWMTEYAYHIILLAKKEPRPKDQKE